MFKELFERSIAMDRALAGEDGERLWKAEYIKNGKVVEKNERWLGGGPKGGPMKKFMSFLTSEWGNVPDVTTNNGKRLITFTYND